MSLEDTMTKARHRIVMDVERCPLVALSGRANRSDEYPL